MDADGPKVDSELLNRAEVAQQFLVDGMDAQGAMEDLKTRTDLWQFLRQVTHQLGDLLGRKTPTDKRKKQSYVDGYHAHMRDGIERVERTFGVSIAEDGAEPALST